MTLQVTSKSVPSIPNFIALRKKLQILMSVSHKLDFVLLYQLANIYLTLPDLHICREQNIFWCKLALSNFSWDKGTRFKKFEHCLILTWKFKNSWIASSTLFTIFILKFLAFNFEITINSRVIIIFWEKPWPKLKTSSWKIFSLFSSCLFFIPHLFPTRKRK